MAKSDNNLKALGFFLAEAKLILGDDLLPRDYDLMTTRPLMGIGAICRKLTRPGVTDEESDDRIACILGMVDMDTVPRGFIHPLQQGELMLASFRYSREMMSAKDAADRLGVSVQRVYQMVNEGKLDGYKVGGKMMLFSPMVDAAAK